jgi:hypothetical protein
LWGDGQPLRPTTNVALSSNAEIRGVFGALARVVLLWGNGAFPGGSIGERVLRGPARKGPTAPQREGWGAPAPATPSIPTIVLLLPSFLFLVYAPGTAVGALHPTPLLSRPSPTTHTPGGSASGPLRCRHPSPPPHPCPSSVHHRTRKVCLGDVWGPRSGGSPPGQWCLSGGIHR